MLIDLLGELPAEKTWTAQDILHQLAGDKAPLATMGDKPEERKQLPRRLGRLVEEQRRLDRPGQAHLLAGLSRVHASHRSEQQ